MSDSSQLYLRPLTDSFSIYVCICMYVYVYIYICVCVGGGGPGRSVGIATDYGLDGP